MEAPLRPCWVEVTYNQSLILVLISSDSTPFGPQPPSKFPSSLPEDLTQDDPCLCLEARGRYTLIFQKKIKMETGSTVCCGQTMQGKGHSCDAVGGLCLAILNLHNNLSINSSVLYSYKKQG